MSRIAIVHWAFPPTIGGVETHLWEFTQRLVKVGHEVRVITGTRNADAPPGVEVHYHPTLDLSSHDGSGLTPWLKGLLEKHRVEIVHGHNLHHFEVEPARALTDLRAELGIRLLHTFHSLWDEEPEHEAMTLIRGWDQHLAVSGFVRGRLRKMDWPLPRAARRYVGVDTSRYRNIPPLPDELTTVLLPARLIPDKGAEVALRAFARVVKDHQHGSTLRLVLTEAVNQVDYHGERDGFRGYLEALTEQLGLIGQVEFVRPTWQDMPTYYESAHVVVCPSSFAEPLGLAALEAQCARRPVICARVGGLPEAVRDKRLILSPDGENSLEQPLAKAISELLENPRMARAMGKRGRSRVLRRFDLDAVCFPKMMRTYSSVDDLPAIRQPGNDIRAASPDGQSKVQVTELEPVHV